MADASAERRGRAAGLSLALASELAGTALLVAAGLSIVIALFGEGSAIIRWLPGAGARRGVAGFLFGCTGALIALSPVGKHSGAHINPAVSFAFALTGTMRAGHAAWYCLAQLAGAALGALPLLAWGAQGRSVQFGATVPGAGWGDGWALFGEAATTFALIASLLLFLHHERWRRFTPAVFPPLYAIMVLLEAPVSGTSTNPARSFGPSLVSGDWRGWWIYWVGPLLGTTLAVALLRHGPLRAARLEVAKLYHFAHDPHGLFHGKRS